MIWSSDLLYNYGFSYTTCDNGWKPFCLLCKTELSVNSATTYNIKRHFDKNHGNKLNISRRTLKVSNICL